MSGINGDRSRFHRVRKQKIARRKRNRELLIGFVDQRKPATGFSSPKPKPTIA
jgi:hypothetical protein